MWFITLIIIGIIAFFIGKYNNSRRPYQIFDGLMKLSYLAIDHNKLTNNELQQRVTSGTLQALMELYRHKDVLKYTNKDGIKIVSWEFAYKNSIYQAGVGSNPTTKNFDMFILKKIS